MGDKLNAFIVNPDGSITETIFSKSIDDIIRAFIRVGATQFGKTAAYKARSKAIKYMKKYSGCAYPDTYVMDLELREFPLEFQRAELGRRYIKLVWLASTLWISLFGILGYYWVYVRFMKLNAAYVKLLQNRPSSNQMI